MRGGSGASRDVKFPDTASSSFGKSLVTARFAIRNFGRLAATAVSVLGFSLSAYALTPQTITFPALPNTRFTSPPPTPAATASSGLPVSYASNSTGVCTIIRIDDQFRVGGNLLDHRLAARQCHLRRGDAGDEDLQCDEGRQHDHLPGASQHALHQPAAHARGDGEFGTSGQLFLDHHRRVHDRRLDNQLRVGGNLLDQGFAGRRRQLRRGDGGDAELQRDEGRQCDHLPGASQHALHQPAARRPRRRRVRDFRSAIPRPPTGVCTIAGSTISFVSAGTCSITASQAGNANYVAATPVTQSFSVTPGVNAITFPALPNTPFSSPPPTPAATASSGLPVSYVLDTRPASAP